MARPPASDTKKQQKKFALIVWLLLAATTAAQIPWLYSIAQFAVPVSYLAAGFIVANSQLVLRLWYLPKPSPPPPWWERWVIWPYFIWTIWAGLYLPFGLSDMAFALAPETRIVGLSIALVCALYSTGIPIRRVVIREVDIPITDLPSSMHGVRFAQITDVHLGPMAPERRVARWIEKVNALQVDHVLLTGDLIASGTEYIPALSRVLGELNPRGHVFAIMGNHDYFGDASVALLQMHENLGHTLLQNRSFQLTPGFSVAGVDDAWRKLTDLDAALRDVPTNDIVLLLSHDPDLFPDSAARKVTLQVSGHIHGGQLAVPFCGRGGSVLRLFRVPWIQGLYRIAESQLWVGAGLGTTGIPVRFGVPSEIPVLRLIPAD